MVAEAARNGNASEAATLAVLMTERGLGGDSIDLDRRLSRFRGEKSPRAISARQLAERLARSFPPSRGGSARSAGGCGGARAQPFPASTAPASHPSHGGESNNAGALLLFAWPDRVRKARGERGRFLLANGRGAVIDEADPLAARPFLS